MPSAPPILKIKIIIPNGPWLFLAVTPLSPACWCHPEHNKNSAASPRFMPECCNSPLESNQ
jgi:hypothetical protein